MNPSGGPKIPPGAEAPGEGAPPGRFPPPSTPLVAAVGRFAAVVEAVDVEFVVELLEDVELPDVVVELPDDVVELPELLVVLLLEPLAVAELLLAVVDADGLIVTTSDTITVVAPPLTCSTIVENDVKTWPPED